MTATDEVQATMRPTLARRVMAAGMLAGAGTVLVWQGLAGELEGAAWRALVVVSGAVLLALAARLWQATALAVELTEKGLRDSAGRILCTFDEIETADRGAFSFRPSNGLVIRLTRPMPLAWQPGLYWRIGRRIGIGGVTPSGEAKNLAGILSVRLAQRRGTL